MQDKVMAYQLHKYIRISIEHL